MYRILKWSGTAIRVVYLLAFLWVFLRFVLKGLHILQKKVIVISKLNYLQSSDTNRCISKT
jgi:hypothetical protein